VHAHPVESHLLQVTLAVREAQRRGRGIAELLCAVGIAVIAFEPGLGLRILSGRKLARAVGAGDRAELRLLRADDGLALAWLLLRIVAGRQRVSVDG